ncbi:MAG: DUF5317 domain-containing protein [Desulfitobacteriaceae bacterium]|nr:DUF5317 domain-containing protein [Desulfitobacteriaceae bacterium]MDD4753625.1 DUF5317 domain-containing protein [Desulfitobacteriaceae bacterium]
MLYEAIIIGIVAGWLAKGSLKNLAQIKMKYIWLVLGAFLIQVGMDYLGAKGFGEIVRWRLPLHLLSYLMLFLFLWLHRELPGIKLLALGFLCNCLVIVINGGAMPATINGIDPEYVKGLQAGDWVTYTAITESTNLPWLGDVLVLPWPKAKAFSLGDIFISAGVFWLVFQVMRGDRVHARLTSVRKMKF